MLFPHAPISASLEFDSFLEIVNPCQGQMTRTGVKHAEGGSCMQSPTPVGAPEGLILHPTKRLKTKQAFGKYTKRLFKIKSAEGGS